MISWVIQQTRVGVLVSVLVAWERWVCAGEVQRVAMAWPTRRFLLEGRRRVAQVYVVVLSVSREGKRYEERKRLGVRLMRVPVI